MENDIGYLLALADQLEGIGDGDDMEISTDGPQSHFRA